ncbi:winged helix-turn-helix transcriptional regulator [Streptomyces sp. NPDC056255]|uniref:winged helix-turn-helix transcriptional regulator n=1 Tax=Streptomyces sp. NPDC056255 TaxID=3345764 RepID=UPI0035D6E83E
MSRSTAEGRIRQSWTCPSFEATLEQVGRRWTGSVLQAAAPGARRFGEYRAMITGVFDRLLSQRLKELEAADLIERTVIPTTPAQIRYQLAPNGQALVDALRPLAQWNTRRGARTRGAGRTPTVCDDLGKRSPQSETPSPPTPCRPGQVRPRQRRRTHHARRSAPHCRDLRVPPRAKPPRSSGVSEHAPGLVTLSYGPSSVNGLASPLCSRRCARDDGVPERCRGLVPSAPSGITASL